MPVFLLFFILFFFSTAPVDAESEKVQIRFWYEWTRQHRTILEGLCRKFESLHPNIRVETLQVSNMTQKLLPAVAGGIPPDVAVFNRPYIANWAAANAFNPLEELISRDGVKGEDFVDACWQECVYDGHTWGIPINTDNRVFFWNKAAFREVGLDPERPPRTWKELEDFAERLTRRDAQGRLDRVGFYPLWGNSYYFIYAYQNRVQFLSEDGRQAIFNTPAALETLEWIVKFARKFNIQSLTNFKTGFGPDAQNPFISGKVAMMVDGSWELDTMRRFAPDLEFGTAPAPIPETGEESTWSGGFALVIPHLSRHVEEAWAFIRFISSYESQMELAKTSNLPVRKAVLEHLMPTMPEGWQVCARLMSKSHFLPKTPTNEEMFTVIERMSEEAVFGRKTPKQALEDAVKESQAILDKFHAQSDYPFVNWTIFSILAVLLVVTVLTVWVLLARHGRLGYSPTRQEAVEGYLFASPWIIGFLLFTAGPIILSFFFSFCDYRVLSPARWVGTGNYRNLIGDDPLFWKSLWNTCFYALFHVPLAIAGALLLAILLNQEVRGIRLFRTIFYLPSVISGVAVSVLWMWILNSEYGLLNASLAKVGVQGPGWLSDPAWSKPAIVVMSMWGIGGGMIIFLAALQGLPRHLYESATIDGANPIHQFLYITIPLISPAIFFNLVIGVISSFQVFTQAYVMTNGGPLDSTLFYALYLFRTAFQFFRMGYASAMAWILFAVVLSLTLLQMKLSRRWVYYESGEGGR